VPKVVLPSLKVTLPLTAPAVAELTVAVSVAFTPNIRVGGAVVTVVLVVAKTVRGTLPLETAKLASPL
jgi:hypothetical protein